jgi:hypothetical protein
VNEEPEIRVRHAELIAIYGQPALGMRGLRTFPAPYISVQLSNGTFGRQWLTSPDFLLNNCERRIG